MYNFNYHRPSSLDQATATLGGAEDGMLMAGGMTLIPTLKQRLANPTDVVDLGAIGVLAGISVSGGNVIIGAMTRHADVASSADVKAQIPAGTPISKHPVEHVETKALNPRGSGLRVP